MFKKLIDVLTEEFKKNPIDITGMSNKCPISGGSLEVPKEFKEMMNQYGFNIDLDIFGNTKKTKSESTNKSSNNPVHSPPSYPDLFGISNISLQPQPQPQPRPRPYPQPRPRLHHTLQTDHQVIEQSLPILSITNSISYICKFLYYLIVFYIIFILITYLLDLYVPYNHSQINDDINDINDNNSYHCPFIDGISISSMSDDELMEDICKLVDSSNSYRKIVNECKKKKKNNTEHFISQSNIQYDAVCFIKKMDKNIMEKINYFKDNYDLSIYFILLKGEKEDLETLNELNDLIGSNNNYKIDIIENKELNKKDNYNIHLLNYIKHASFVLNLENFDDALLDSIIKLCIVSETPFLLYTQNKTNNYNKYEELKWGYFYQEEKYKEKIKDFMENYCDFYN